jgi:hydrogenase-4 component E
MTGYASFLLVVLLALDLYMVGTTRIDACIRASILQAIVLALLPFTLGAAGPHAALGEQLHLVLLAGATQVVKGIVIPWLLLRGLRDMGTYREFEPFVSLHYSQVINGLLCIAAFWIAAALPWPTRHGHTLALGVTLATLLIGLYMTINRRKTISQVLGYLVMESGLFVGGWTLLGKPSLLVELGVLLDLLVGCMVMGILATHIEVAADEGDETTESAEFDTGSLPPASQASVTGEP